VGKTLLVIGVLGLVIGVIGAWSLGQPKAPEPPSFASDAQRHAWVLGTLLPWMEQFRERYHNVPRSDGEFLRWLIIATNADGRWRSALPTATPLFGWVWGWK
jgi:hypothetical protein